LKFVLKLEAVKVTKKVLLRRVYDQYHEKC